MNMDIKIDLLDPQSIKKAETQLRKYKKSLNSRAEKLCKWLAEFGVGYAQVYFDNAYVDVDRFDGEPLKTTNIYVTMTKNGSENGVVYTVKAAGKDIAFIEFGAGVHFNGGGDPYHEKRLDGIVGIGQYGKGYGKRDSWVYNGDDGKPRITVGTPEQPGMYLTAKEMRSKITEIAREVFANDRH